MHFRLELVGRTVRLISVPRARGNEGKLHEGKIITTEELYAKFDAGEDITRRCGAALRGVELRTRESLPTNDPEPCHPRKIAIMCHQSIGVDGDGARRLNRVRQLDL